MPAYVQHANLETHNPGSPQTVSLSGVTAGNLLCLIAFVDGSSITINTPSDNHSNYWQLCTGTAFNDPGDAINGTGFYAASVAGGSTTVTVSWTGTEGYIAFYLFEISGANTYDNGSGNSGGTTTTASSGSFNTNYANEIVIAADILGGNGSAQGAGYTLIEITSSFADVLEYAIVSPGSQNATCTQSPGSFGMIAAAFYENGGITPTVLPTDVIFYGIT